LNKCPPPPSNKRPSFNLQKRALIRISTDTLLIEEHGEGEEDVAIDI